MLFRAFISDFMILNVSDFKIVCITKYFAKMHFIVSLDVNEFEKKKNESKTDSLKFLFFKHYYINKLYLILFSIPLQK